MEGSPTEKFMGPGRFGQFWRAELKNRWYTGVWWDFNLIFMIQSLILVKVMSISF